MDKLTDKSIELVNFIKSNMMVNTIDINNDTISHIKETINQITPEYNNRITTSTIDIQKEINDPPVVFDVYKKIKDLRSVIPAEDIDKVKDMIASDGHESFIEWYLLNHRYLDIPYDIGKREIDKLKYPHNLKKSLYGSPFMAIDIQKYFESHKFYHTKCTCSFKNDKLGDIVIDLYEPYDHKQINIDEIIKICSMMRLFKPKHANVQINLTLIASHLKKKLGKIKGSDIILPKHVNSASTMRGEFIYIWRYEEWKKILIHELIHYLKIDFDPHKSGFGTLVESLNSIFKVSGNLFPFESYTEIIAVLIHSVYVSQNLDIKLEEILLYELNFSLFQCAKILKYIGFTDIETFITPSMPSDLQLTQMTGTLSYFFIKTALLNNSQLFSYLGPDINFKDTTLTTNYLKTIYKQSKTNTRFSQ